MKLQHLHSIKDSVKTLQELVKSGQTLYFLELRHTVASFTYYRVFAASEGGYIRDVSKLIAIILDLEYSVKTYCIKLQHDGPYEIVRRLNIATKGVEEWYKMGRL